MTHIHIAEETHMATQREATHGTLRRRGIIAGAAALAAGLLATKSESVAAGTDGDVILGQANSSAFGTSLFLDAPSSITGGIVLHVVSNVNNNRAIDAQGSGTSSGIAGTGGGSSGAGVIGNGGIGGSADGVQGNGTGAGVGVRGVGAPNGGAGVLGMGALQGTNSQIGSGVVGTTNNFPSAINTSPAGVVGLSSIGNIPGVYGHATQGDTPGVYGSGANGGAGVFGINSNPVGIGMYGFNDSGVAVKGHTTTGTGVFGESVGSGAGVRGQSSTGIGVYGVSGGGASPFGVVGSVLTAPGFALFGIVNVAGAVGFAAGASVAGPSRVSSAAP